MYPINSTRRGVGFLREGREWETLARLNYSASGENMELMPLNNASWQGLSSPIPLSASLPLSARAESGGISRDENGFRNVNVMLEKREFGILHSCPYVIQRHEYKNGTSHRGYTVFCLINICSINPHGKAVYNSKLAARRT